MWKGTIKAVWVFSDFLFVFYVAFTPFLHVKVKMCCIVEIRSQMSLIKVEKKFCSQRMEAGVAPAATFLFFRHIHSSVISASPKIAWLQWIFSANHRNKHPESFWALSLESYLNKIAEKMSLSICCYYVEKCRYSYTADTLNHPPEITNFK